MKKNPIEVKEGIHLGRNVSKRTGIIILHFIYVLMFFVFFQLRACFSSNAAVWPDFMSVIAQKRTFSPPNFEAFLSIKACFYL